MLMAKMENLLSAPPENTSSKPKRLPLLKSSFDHRRVHAGNGNLYVPAPENYEHRNGEDNNLFRNSGTR
jgi:hypothetical protein